MHVVKPHNATKECKKHVGYESEGKGCRYCTEVTSQRDDAVILQSMSGKANATGGARYRTYISVKYYTAFSSMTSSAESSL